VLIGAIALEHFYLCKTSLCCLDVFASLYLPATIPLCPTVKVVCTHAFSFAISLYAKTTLGLVVQAFLYLLLIGIYASVYTPLVGFVP
jgi:hypothetical protein